MDVADIHQLEANTGVWLVFIEGISVAFTTTEDIAGTSWISSFPGREIKSGLQMPATLPLGESTPWEGTIRSPQSVAFTVTDLDGTLAALFADIEPDISTDTLGQRLSPLDDPAPDPAVGLDSEVITLWDRNVGIERIGPAGERRYFWGTPSDVPPGLDHPAPIGYPAARVTDDPSTWAGRKVFVYRIVKDPDTGTWPEWDAQYEGGSLWWYGTMTDRGEWRETSNGRAFVFYALGPASWIERSLNLARPTEWYKPTGGVTLTAEQGQVACWIEPLERIDLGDGINFTVTQFDCQTFGSGNALAGLTTRGEIAAKISDIAKAMVDGGVYNGVDGTATNAVWLGPGGSAGVWNDGTAAEIKRRVRVTASGAQIGIKCDPEEPAPYGFRFALALDVRVWELLGWDVSRLIGVGEVKGELPVGGTLWGEGPTANLLPAYHKVGYFSTRDDADPGFESTWDNGGAWRDYLAHYPAGVMTLDDKGGDEVYVAVGSVRAEGQHAQPFTLGSQINGVDCDSAGWWIFRGVRRTAAAAEKGIDDTAPYIGVALCEWVATSDGGGVEVNGDGMATIRIIRWESPRRFGLPYDVLREPWANAVGALECAPLGVLGGIATDGTYTAPGWRFRIIPSLLLSSGTAVWDDSGASVTITPGVNHPPDLPAGEPWPGDLEVADLGCGLPAAFVDWQSWLDCQYTLPEGLHSALGRPLYALYGSEKSSAILAEAMRGAGWAWSLKRKAGGYVPAFGAFDPLKPLSPAGAVVTLTRAKMAEFEITDEAQWRGTVELRRVGPVDRFTLEVGHPPLDDGEGEPYTHEMESDDYHRRARSGRITWEATDRGIRDPAPWIGGPAQQLFDWTGQARTRFAGGFGRRLALQLRVYRAIYQPQLAGVLGLGSIVRVTDSTAEGADGVRGVDHMGRVTELEIVSRASGRCCVRVAVELDRLPVNATKVWGPLGYSGRGGWDSGTSELTISDDWAGVGGDHSDATGWTQPSWSTLAAGQLRVQIYQSEDGETFDAGLVTADVVTVDAGALTIELDNITGTLYRDTVKIIVGAALDDAGQTAAWVEPLFAPITDPAGLWDTNVKGTRLK